MTGLFDLPGVCAHEFFRYLSTQEIMDLSLCSKAASRFTQLVRLKRKEYKDWNFIGMHDPYEDSGHVNYHPLELIFTIKKTPKIAQHILKLLMNPDWRFPIRGYTEYAQEKNKQTIELLQESEGWLRTEVQRFADAGILDDSFAQSFELSYDLDYKGDKVVKDWTDDMHTMMWLVVLSMLPQLDHLMFTSTYGSIQPFIEKLVRYQHSLEHMRHDQSSLIDFITPTRLTIFPLKRLCVLSARCLTTLLLLPTLQEVTCYELKCHQFLSWPTWTHLCNSEPDDDHIEVFSNVTTMRFDKTWLHAEAIAEFLKGMPKLTVLQWDGNSCQTVISGSQHGQYVTLEAQDWERHVKDFYLAKTGEHLRSTVEFVCDDEESGEESGEESDEESDKDSGEESGEESGKESGKESGEESGKESGEESDEESDDECGEESDDECGEESDEESNESD